MKTYEKIDEETVKVTETFEQPEPIVTLFDRAELKTELFHVSDDLPGLQEQMDAINKRKAELIDILKVFN